MQNNADENHEESTRDNDRQKILSEAMQLGDVNTRRIFSYQEKAPAAPESHQNPLRVVYSIKTPMSTKSGSRYIPTSPERILDAPDIINDYCKHVTTNFTNFQWIVGIKNYIFRKWFVALSPLG